MATTAPTPNGVPAPQTSQSQTVPSSSAGPTTQATSQTSQGPATTQQSSQTVQPSSQPQQTQQTVSSGALPGDSQPQQSQQQHQHGQQQQQQQQQQQGGSAPRPRDSRTMELLLTAQGVQSYESRVPLFLLDFAYRHTTAVLTDAIHLAADPNYLSKGGGGGGGSSAEPVIKASAVQTAIASRLAYQYRGGGGAAGGGGASKDWMLDIARERNKVALPRINANEWGVRLPNEKFVLSGVNWGLKEVWAGPDGEEDSSDEDEGEDENMADAAAAAAAPGGGGAANRTTNGDAKEVDMEDAEDEEGEGTYEDFFGRDADGDAEMS